MQLTRVLFYATMLATPVIIAVPAEAAVVVTGTNTITAADPTAPVRILRNATASTWTTQKAYPGASSAGSYAYQLLDGTFAANAVQKIFYEVSYTSALSGSVFSTAYMNAFSSTDLSLHYLGDAGRSPDVNPDTVTYQIAVDAGQSLVLHFGAVISRTTGQTYGYTINAFSDANRGENFLPVNAAVPEPATWAMMLIGFGGIGFAMRRRKSKVTINVAFA